MKRFSLTVLTCTVVILGAVVSIFYLTFSDMSGREVIGVNLDAGFVARTDSDCKADYATENFSEFEKMKFRYVYLGVARDSSRIIFCGMAEGGSWYKTTKQTERGSFQVAGIYNVRGCNTTPPPKCDKRGNEIEIIFKKNWSAVVLMDAVLFIVIIVFSMAIVEIFAGSKNTKP